MCCQSVQRLLYGCLNGCRNLTGILLEPAGSGVRKRYRVQALRDDLPACVQNQRTTRVSALVYGEYVIHCPVKITFMASSQKASGVKSAE